MASKGCELDSCKAVDLGFIHDSLKLRHKNVKKKCEPYMATAMLNKKATCFKNSAWLFRGKAKTQCIFRTCILCQNW